jgi:hypothetical protein
MFGHVYHDVSWRERRAIIRSQRERSKSLVGLPTVPPEVCVPRDSTGPSGSATFTWTVGSSAPNTVTVTNPGSQSGTVGTATSLQIHASDSASGQTLTYSASEQSTTVATAANNGTSYAGYSANLAAYIGQTITIKFTAIEVSGGNTQFLEDSNGLNVS